MNFAQRSVVVPALKIVVQRAALFRDSSGGRSAITRVALQAMKPRLASAAERWRWLRLTHRNGASGSPRIDGSTSSFRASKIPGCVSIAGFCRYRPATLVTL